MSGTNKNDVSWKSSQSTDKTTQPITVSVQSAFRWLSHRPWAICTTGQLLHRWLAAACQTRPVVCCCSNTWAGTRLRMIASTK